jgi:aspartate/methionine/tyrosine aminotransferase
MRFNPPSPPFISPRKMENRQVFALVNHPALLAHPEVGRLFPPDAIDRAKRYVAAIPGGTGAYSNSQGVEALRAEVAAFIAARDGYAAHASDIFLTDGASPAGGCSRMVHGGGGGGGGG